MSNLFVRDVPEEFMRALRVASFAVGKTIKEYVVESLSARLNTSEQVEVLLDKAQEPLPALERISKPKQPSPRPAPSKACPRCEKAMIAWGADVMRCENCKQNFPVKG